MLAARRPAVLAVAFVCGLVTAVSAVPQNRVDDVIAKNIEAKGGLERIQAITTIKQVATTTMNGSDAKMTSYSKRPNMQRLEMKVEGKLVISSFDGETAWMQNPFMGVDRPIVLGAAQVEMIKEQSLFDGLLPNLKALGYTATVEGTDTAGDRKLIHLKLVSAAKQVRHIYLDATTYLEARITTEQNQMKLEQELSDYRDVKGLKQPFLIRMLVNGAVQSEIKVQTIEFNEKMDDSLFRIPKGF
jgi:outer membrane lipoprotein-sorting protein